MTRVGAIRESPLPGVRRMWARERGRGMPRPYEKAASSAARSAPMMRRSPTWTRGRRMRRGSWSMSRMRSSSARFSGQRLRDLKDGLFQEKRSAARPWTGAGWWFDKLTPNGRRVRNSGSVKGFWKKSRSSRSMFFSWSHARTLRQVCQRLHQ